jgi:transcription-repair coupling factor (superfamily II helicase)
MRGILKPLKSSDEYAGLVRGLKQNLRQAVFGLSGSQCSYLFAGLAEAVLPLPVLVVAPNEREAGRLADETAGFLPGVAVKLFPVMQLLPYQVLAHNKEVQVLRLQVLESLVKGKSLVVVAPAEALMRRLVPPGVFGRGSVRLSVGDRVERDSLLQRLLVMGYERVGLVEDRGQLGLRGGILDIFPMTGFRPVRLEFFDDELDSIRIFNSSTQCSEENITDLTVFPAREFIAAPATWKDAQKSLAREYKIQHNKLIRSGDREAARQFAERFGTALSENAGYLSGIEHFLPYFYREEVTLVDYFPKTAPVFIAEPSRVKEAVASIQRERAETYAELIGRGKVLPSQLSCYVESMRLQEAVNSRCGVYCSLLPRQSRFVEPQKVINFPAKAMRTFRSNLEIITGEIAYWKKSGQAVVILMSGSKRARQLLSFLKEGNIDAFYTGSSEGNIRKGNVVVTVGNLRSGFELPACGLVVITEGDLYGHDNKLRKTRQRRGSMAPFVDLKTGDYVVHVNHGIGRYLGVVPLTIGGIQKEYLLVKYAGEDKLYVPVDQVGQLQKYLGGEGQAPRTSRLGGGEWARTKGKVREAVKEMAGELLALYAARETVKGHAFGPDTVWQREFEDTFPYEETPDQLRAIEEVKSDMERSRPMDRLLCGDVGYGKTEVALRAAFKAVMDGKQVAVLVPTTILAQQHHLTFSERLAGFPINVEVLSRFRTSGEQSRVLAGLRLGTVDIVIGTHRLVQKDVSFKDLGLLIVDEEQRFGVAHKEQLKMIRKNVDVLTLSATPIPRTLHLSLIGVRDTSILETPPEDRYPIQTYVLEEDPALIREAIQRELSRGGQVFFVYNRVLDLDRVAVWLQGLVPGARVALAHGQMQESRLEQIMLDFVSREIDVLVCTSIIENGLDIPNVNTLVVKEAGMMGLAQLYQLRGRIGRSSRLAYAYFTFRKDRVLGEAAEKRLAAIREFTELGSGFKIAMRDLEIRGAGNILGVEQHGHIAAVGFDLYCRLLEDAVREAKGEEKARAVETNVELPVEAYIPGDYIPDTNQKVEIYKRMAGLLSEAELSELADELADRFGDLPGAVQSLLAVARVRVLASHLKIKNINLLPGQLRLLFAPDHALTGEDLVALSGEYRNQVKFNNLGHEFEIKLRVVTGADRPVSPGLLETLELFLRKLQNRDREAAGKNTPATTRQVRDL